MTTDEALVALLKLNQASARITEALVNAQGKGSDQIFDELDESEIDLINELNRRKG